MLVSILSGYEGINHWRLTLIMLSVRSLLTYLPVGKLLIAFMKEGFFFLSANETAPTIARSGLNADVLSLLGAEVVTDVPYSPPIHQDVGDRWLHIIKLGLDEEGRTELIKKYPSPENAKHFGVPKLNPLVKHAAVELVIKRDERLSRQQAQISASLSAISKTITFLLNKEEGGANSGDDSKEIIEHLGDTGRLLADIHHTFSMSRRDLVSLNLNKDLKDPLMDSPVDEWLFGEDLNERLKTAKDLQASSKQLLITKQPVKKTGASKMNLNWKGPPKRIQGARRSGPYNHAPSTSKYQMKYRSAPQKHRSRYQDERRNRRQ